MVERARVHARVCARAGAHATVSVRVCTHGHATRGCVLVCGRTARVGSWARSLEHVFVGFSSPIHVRVRYLLALLIDGMIDLHA
jgi:hypothetical protein